MKGRVLIIAGSDSGGGAGIQADIKAVTALNAYAMTAITALTVQDTTGVHDVFPVPVPIIEAQARVVLADIGVAAGSDWHEIATPALPPLDPGGHKYSRGLVHALAGQMPGAIALSAAAAARSGAGYVRVSTSRPIEGLPDAVVQIETAPVNDERIGCLLVGPGLGDSDDRLAGRRIDRLERSRAGGLAMFTADQELLRSLVDEGAGGLGQRLSGGCGHAWIVAL